MDKAYWEQYYIQHRSPGKPSPFAEEIFNYLQPNTSLLELGCGNGRDSVYFSDHQIQVTGIDQTEVEMAYLAEHYANENLKFICDDFTKITKLNGLFDSIYSRFTFHAISEEQEEHVLLWIKENIKPGGYFFLEVRSLKDKLFLEGEEVAGEKNARVTTHYRRFSDFVTIEQKIVDLGFAIEYSVESDGLAKHGSENPIIIRIIAKAAGQK